MSAPPTPDETLVLRDGSTVTVRPITAQDEAAIAGFLARLSPESQAFRFFAAPTDVSEIAKRLAISNLEVQFGLAARYVRSPLKGRNVLAARFFHV